MLVNQKTNNNAQVREEKKREEEATRSSAKPPFIVGKARSPFKSVEQFLKVCHLKSKVALLTPFYLF